MTSDDRNQNPEGTHRGRRALMVRLVVLSVATVVVLGLLLFVPAGTLAWEKGWLFLLVFVAAQTIIVPFMWHANPEVLEARSRVRWEKHWDLVVGPIIMVGLLAIFPVAALDDVRYHWYSLPWWVCGLGYLLFLVGMGILTWAAVVNKFAETSVRIQVERGHRVIDSGPYAFVRHPMYVGAIPFFAGIALCLGSLWALIPAGLAIVALILRTHWEDQTLQAELPGYKEYIQRVRYRLFPGCGDRWQKHSGTNPPQGRFTGVQVSLDAGFLRSEFSLPVKVPQPLTRRRVKPLEVKGHIQRRGGMGFAIMVEIRRSRTMPRTWSIRLQTALVIALFLGSSATVLVSTVQTMLLPQREFQMRDRLREASQRMADAAEPELRSFQAEGGRPFEALNQKLRAISDRVLADIPGVEGGFYLDAEFDRFAGFAFPTEPPDSLSAPDDSPPVPEEQPALPGKGMSQPFTPHRGDEPPPREGPFILVQVKHSLTLDPGEFQFDVRTIGPSRVAIVTQPIGPDRPAHSATWTMFRLVSPESQEGQLRRYQVSTGLALGGIALAGLLTLNLGKTLRRQRLEQEQLREELRRSEHLAALGKLLAGVAHEVRNPLAGIRSTVQLWERLPDTTRTSDSIHAVVQAVDRLNEIVSRLLYFSRMDNNERQPVSVNSVLTETLNLLEAQAASQSVTIQRDLDPSLPNVSGSASGLRSCS